MGGLAVWITGLPGSGKSTAADGIKRLHPDFVILRMDELRKVATPDPAYSHTEREVVYRSLVYFARMLTELGHNVIIDATGNRRDWRDLARRLIPDFIEVYLKCTVEECGVREKKRTDMRGAPAGIYGKGKAGWPVPGVNVPYEEPLNPEVEIETTCSSAEDTVRLIDDSLKRILKD
ncbi:MAG: adenylyl-sulfate kinase [Candidatus Sulfobium sp.]|jgi:adenylylsulfate kinase